MFNDYNGDRLLCSRSKRSNFVNILDLVFNCLCMCAVFEQTNRSDVFKKVSRVDD